MRITQEVVIFVFFATVCVSFLPVKTSFILFLFSHHLCSTVNTTTFQSVDDHINLFDASSIELRVDEDHFNSTLHLSEVTCSSSSLSSLLSPSSSSSLELDSNHYNQQKVCFVCFRVYVFQCLQCLIDVYIFSSLALTLITR